VFQFGSLPREIQVMILLKAAVTCKTLRQVYVDLAWVSHAWREMIYDRWFDEQIKQQAYEKGQLDNIILVCNFSVN